MIVNGREAEVKRGGLVVERERDGVGKRENVRGKRDTLHVASIQRAED